MKRVDLVKIEHQRKAGETCEYIEPNIIEDSIFYADDKPIGFYMSKMPEQMRKLAELANAELLSNRVPKSVMTRQRPDGKNPDGTYKYKDVVEQYSVILGGVPPKPHMRRNYKTISSVHSVKTAQVFIKAMLMLCKQSELLIKEILPEQYNTQLELLNLSEDKYKFGSLFTSSISNFNIAAAFHRDAGNIEGTVNVIICKRLNSKGGDLTIPDYGATIGQVDNSILVYPAWRNMHGVTPIVPTHKGGYRNSLIFYPLNAFKMK